MSQSSVPPSLKALSAYLKTAAEMEKRDPVVAYYCRLYSVQRGMEIDRKSAESKKFLMELMDKLDKNKNELKDNESIISEVVGQAHLEEYALRLFMYADSKDKEGDFGPATINSFITAGYLMDVMGVFGEVGEDLEKCRKYAKWKAVYINQCLKKGEVPHCGPLDDQDQLANANDLFLAKPSQPTVTPVQPPVPTARAQKPLVPDSKSSASNLPTPSTYDQAPTSTNKAEGLSPEDFTEAEKYCRYATSALQYQDSETAIKYLRQCLELLSHQKK